MIPHCEGRNIPFSFFLRMLPRAPKFVVYDYACQLREYCFNREWEYFKGTLFFMDRFHAWNHSTCTISFFLEKKIGDLLVAVPYAVLQLLNSEMAEHFNSPLASCASLYNENHAYGL